MIGPLYKTCVTIWTDFDPTGMSLSDLGWQAEAGDGYCSSMSCDLIPEPEKDKDWDGSEFFGVEDDA